MFVIAILIMLIIARIISIVLVMTKTIIKFNYCLSKLALAGAGAIFKTAYFFEYAPAMHI